MPVATGHRFQPATTTNMKRNQTTHSILTLGASLLVAILAGCATAPTVTSHPDSSVNYSNYKTFAMMNTSSLSSAINNPNVSPALIRQVREETAAAFVAKGLTKAPTNSADLLVLVHGGLQEKIDITDWGLSYGRFGRGYAGLGGQYGIDQYQEGKIMIEVFDAKTREFIWRGSVVGEVSDSPKPEQVKTAISAVVARYPN